MKLILLQQLIQVEDIEMRLEMKKPHDLLDHIQVGFWSIPCYIYLDFSINF